MKALFALLAFAALLALANAQERNSDRSPGMRDLPGSIKDVDVSNVDKETADLLSKTVLYVNEKYPKLAASSNATPQLLKRTRQIVNGLKSTFTFKIPVQNSNSYLYYAEVLNAPWTGQKNKITKACVLDLTTVEQSCSDGDEWRNLALAKAICF